MRLERTERFKRAYKRLSRDEQDLSKKALRNLLGQGLRYPALHVKRIKGTRSIWEARVSRGCRMTFQLDGDRLILRNVGAHDATLDRP